MSSLTLLNTQVIKGIIYVLGLLRVKVLVSFAAMLAFVLFLFRSDPILAAVPAVFVLPAIVLQPWFLVFILLPGQIIVAPVLTTIISMPPYWWQPSMTEGTRVLSTPSFPLDERGPDGWHALATWNPDDQVLHVWIKDNF